MHDNSNQAGGVLSTRQEKKLKKSQTDNVSCNLQDMMQSHQPDETGSGAPSGAGASGEPAGDYVQRDNILFNKYSTPTRNPEHSSGTSPNSMPTTIKPLK